ncbi:MAG: DUF1501 domain-containing protein [Planctomycetes bacterium]|nr:DUF1501 domain-containing protein [Planctomycetota bacterium]
MSRLDQLQFTRRTALQLTGLAGASWLTTAAHLLAVEEENERKQPAQSIILLWMAGGPSQLETFDPHPGKRIAAGTRAIPTAVPGVLLAEGLEQTADQMQSIALVRSLVSKEGDHERGTYLVKTGYSPTPTLVHPSIGAICCHELPLELPSGLRTEIPRHVSILPNRFPGRGGFLGDGYDAFKTFDPSQKVPDVTTHVPDSRFEARLRDLEIVESSFARRRMVTAESTLHRKTLRQARMMMTSEQLAAFDISQEPASVRAPYGDTPFGRGCLAARRLIERGVRCVEVTLDGWDSHANNHETQRARVQTLDPAFAALLRDLRERQLLERTVVICAGEFGRTPTVNKLEGRDHWPHGFTIALAGGGIHGGQVLGATDPEGGREVQVPQRVADVHATVLAALGIDWTKEIITPIQRPIRLSEGEPIRKLL